MHIQHITLQVNNMEKSIEFYETVTQLNVDRRYKEEPGEIAFMTNGKGETEIELVYMPQMQKFEGKGMFICFVTDNLDEMKELVVSRGFNTSEIKNPDIKNRYFYVYDPNGVSIQIKQKL